MKTIRLAVKILIVSLDTVRYRMLNRWFDRVENLAIWADDRREWVKTQLLITLTLTVLLVALMGAFFWAVESHMKKTVNWYHEPIVTQMKICPGLIVEVTHL